MFRRFPSSLLLVLAFVVSAAAGPRYVVQRVVDGDTLKLSNGERVRLIGIDTPELHKSKKLTRDARRSHQSAAVIQQLGRKAADFTTLLALGKTVELEFDPANIHHHHRDRYGRLLAYVYIRDPLPRAPPLDPALLRSKAYRDGFLNALLVEAGYAHAYTIFPFAYQREFLDQERDARIAGRGLWREESRPTAVTQADEPE